VASGGAARAVDEDHCGTIPYLATRFSIIDEMNVIPGAEERGTAADTLRRLYWDTALSWRPPILRMLRSEVGVGQVLFGSDYPYLRRDLAVGCRHQVETSVELDSEESRAILAHNALKLFPRLAARVDREEIRPPLAQVTSARTRSP
jgi:predicted TIM-barrel fold metal-dependent hydrolase